MKISPSLSGLVYSKPRNLSGLQLKNMTSPIRGDTTKDPSSTSSGSISTPEVITVV